MPGRVDRTANALLVAALLFGSGACALVYQVAWQREFRLIFGMSTAASAAVLAVFMGGLGAGGLLLGRRADRHPRPLWLYAQLELGVAFAAASTPLLVGVARSLYESSGGSPELGLARATLLRLLLATAVLLPATLCAGATLPAACRAVQRASDGRRRSTALLYGVNTMGALAGCIAANFYLLEALGTRATLWLGSGLNLMVAVLAAAYSRRLRAESPTGVTTDEPAAPPIADAGVLPTRAAVVLAAAALSGFVFFLMEIVWYRLLGPILGGTVYTFGLILATALAGIALGGLGYAALAPRRPTPTTLSVTFLLQACALFAPYALGDEVSLLAMRLRPAGHGDLLAYLPGWLAVTGVVVLPTALVAGAQFPLLVALIGRGRSDVASHVAALYACNTAGAIAGALGGGFGLLPLLTAPGCWVLAIGMLLGGAVMTIVAADRTPRRTLVLTSAVVGVIAGALPGVAGPTAAWRHSGVGAGRAPRSFEDDNDRRAWLHDARRSVLWEQEGIESSVAVSRSSGLALLVNGKSDGHARGDASTAVMSGLLGPLLKVGTVRTALVVGLGTGTSAGWLAAVPGVEHVDVVELEPAVARVARECAAVNQDVMRNPRVRLLMGDARESLTTGRASYDVIFSEPSNPYRSGVSSLFTKEFYEASRARMAADGMFLQWVQAYEVDQATIHVVIATLASVFRHVSVWRTQHNDLLLVATDDSGRIGIEELRRRVSQEPFASGIRSTWRVSTAEGVLAHHVAGEALARSIVGSVAPNTDDRNAIEFGFARALATRKTFDIHALRRDAVGLAAGEAAVVGDFDRGRVEAARLSATTAWGQFSPDPLVRTDPRRLEAHSLYTAGRTGSAAVLLRSLPSAELDMVEIGILAEGLADAGDPAAAEAIAKLRAFQPTEADALLARLRLRQRRFPEAVSALVQALTRYRVDPWPDPLVMKRSLGLAEDLARNYPPLARVCFDLLELPFAVRLLDEQRLAVRMRMATLPALAGRCADAFAEPGRWFPWDLALLGQRADCAGRTGDPRLAAAAAEVEQYLAAEGPPS